MFSIDQSRFALALCFIPMIVACSETTSAPPSHAQARPSTSYMGEAPPFAEATVFAPGIVSKTGRYEYALSLHPDGHRLLFSAEAPENGAAVFQSRLGDGVWSTPTRVELSGGAHKSEMEAFFSLDGSRVFFAPYTKGMDVRIWSAEVTAAGFANPQPLGPPVADDPSFYPVQAADGSLIYTNLAQRTIFRATLDNGVVSGAGPAGLAKGGHAYPSPDGRFMLVDSASLESHEQRDIFVAFRRDDGAWGPIHPLGPEVNSEHSETCPSLSPDGAFLFFSRYDEAGGISNIYWISAEVIEDAAPV
ncbi:MAG: hypothetical protein V2I67_08920 [Thermoanaerobaculales bacterium]|jgi:Tol biopolymer transport system component|nr:hypothetical protein [Thermoanaerobaculales bacterium]